MTMNDFLDNIITILNSRVVDCFCVFYALHLNYHWMLKGFCLLSASALRLSCYLVASEDQITL
jgi:hypothetical protein